MTEHKKMKINLFLGVVLLVALGVQQAVIMEMGSMRTPGVASAAGLTGDVTKDSIALVLSQGAPEVYGSELGVSFDAVQESINIMRQLDPAYGTKDVGLTSDEQARYTDVGTRISCEYCCGAKSIVFPDGSPACGCAHSIAMRGLIAYLVKFHGDTYSNDEILRELARWKGMFFPWTSNDLFNVNRIG